MTGTVGGFCRDLLDDHEGGLRPGTEGVAARFVEYFQISARPDLDELTALVRRAGFGEVAEMSLEEGLKGVHFGTAGDEYHIYYRDELWQGSKEYTVLHEMYEIMHETLCELHSGTRAPTKVCREADRFAAEVLMQPEGFRALAEAWRLDVAALQRETATPTPPWPCAWPRWCAVRRSWWCSTSALAGGTRPGGPPGMTWRRCGRRW